MGLLMEGHRGGRAYPSFKEVVASRGKKPLESTKGASGGGKETMEEERTGGNTEGINGTKDKEGEDKKQGTEDKKQKGPYKPNAKINPRVVLNDPALQAYRDHMQTYAIICKFMGL